MTQSSSDLQIHHVVFWIGAVQGIEVDLADRTPVCPHLGNEPGGKVTCDSRSSTCSRFSKLVVSSPKIISTVERPKIDQERTWATPGMPVITVSIGMVTCCSICSAEMPGHWVMTSTVVVRDVGIGFDGKPMERNDAPAKQQDRSRPARESGSSAQSRRACGSLRLQRGFQLKYVGDHLLAGRDAGENLLPVPRQHLAGIHFNALELISSGRDEDPVAVVQVKDGRAGTTA